MDRMMKAIATELAASPAKRKQLQVIVQNPPAKAWSRHSRDELVAALREQRDAWELMSRRCQDLPDTRLAVEPRAALVQSIQWYYSDEARAIAAGWLVELLQHLESTDRSQRPKATTRKSASPRATQDEALNVGKRGSGKEQGAPKLGKEHWKREGFRYFECKDGGSSKFWAIRVRGRRYTVTFGRIGAPGTVQTKELGDPDACKHKATVLVDQKQAKGYRER